MREKMSEETLALSDAPELIETEAVETEVDTTVDVAEVVEDEQKSEELSDSSPDEEVKLTQADIDKVAAKLTKKRRAAERDAEYWREQAMKKEPEKPVEVVEEPLKTLADFDYDEGKYQQHLFSKARAEAVDEAKRVLRDEQGQQAVSRKVSEFRGREADFSKDVDDYQEVVQNPELAISQTMADVAMDMDNGPEVLYYLGKNSDLAYEIANLSPLAAARELGRIEAKIQLQEKTGETVSKAPAPAPKITATTPATKKSMDEMSQREFNEYRRKQIANRGR